MAQDLSLALTILQIVGIVVGVLFIVVWLFVPFAIFGTKTLLRDILAELEDINARLDDLEDRHERSPAPIGESKAPRAREPAPTRPRKAPAQGPAPTPQPPTATAETDHLGRREPVLATPAPGRR